MISKIKKWIRKNKGEFYLLLLILAVGAILRLYKIGGYMTFLGDEGRDAIIVRRLLVNFDPVLIGPGTSIGNMYLGPLYYYLSAPFLLFANFSPVGPSVMVALFGVATIYLIWYIARLWFGKGAGMVSSLLYALAPVVIIYNRSSWNPNIMPFFALLTIFSLWKVWGEEKFSWFVVMGVSFAFVLQSHYLGLLLLPVILFFWSLKHWGLFRNSDLEISNYPGNYLKKSYIKNLLIGTIVFAVLMSPLLIFDLRHNFMNFNNIKTFFTQRETTVSVKPWKSLPNIYPIFRDSVVLRLVAAQNILAGKISINIIVFAVVTYVVLILTKLKKILFTSDEKLYFDKGALLLIVWIGLGLIGLGLYKQHVYDHYFGFIFPAIFLVIGAIYQKIMNRHFDGLKIIITAWIIILIGAYVVNSPLRGEPNFQMARAVDVAKVIREDAGNSKFNLAVVAVQNYEDGYQYFLEKDGANVVDIDALRLEETMGEYLYVVCELPEKNCDPVNSPKAEVANFGWSMIEKEWGLSGITIFKLAHVTP